MEKIDNILKEKYKLFFIGYFALIVGIAFFRFPDIRNELKYFAITDQMLENHRFLVLKYFDELYPDKPPIYFWLLAFIRSVFQKNFYPIALIFGGVIPAGVSAFFSFKISKKIWGEKMAFISTAILVTLPYLFGISLVMRMDYLMMMFISIALYIFFDLYYSKNKMDIKRVTVFYISIALGILVKGGAAFAIPLITILTFLFLDKNMSFLKKFRPVLGILILGSILGTWFYLLSISVDGKEYIKLLLGQETLGRMVRAKTHTKPLYFYLRQLPLTTLPIAPFFLMGVYSLLKKIKNFKKWKNIDKISFCWFIPNLIFFSVLSGKLDIYMLPLYPAIVIISLRFIEKTWSGTKEKIYKKILYINIGVLSIVSIALPYYNQNYTLKPIVNSLSESNDRVFSYKFTDAKNMAYEIKRNNIENIPLNKIEELSEGDLILIKNKNKSDLNKFRLEEVYKNKEYSILIKIN
ncbi:MAG: glycosyltransferase family 39 protein [Cetobacterium sp.]|uniref:ArnT family glycosyltransferase n=1 Tax=Cetobacterium sp. TaxID=2071632 RepID=UPI002FCA1896